MAGRGGWAPHRDSAGVTPAASPRLRSRASWSSREPEGGGRGAGRHRLHRDPHLSPPSRTPSPPPVAAPPRPPAAPLSLTAPDPQLELGLVQVLHIIPQEAVQQVRDHRLKHHGGAEAAGGGAGTTERSPGRRMTAPRPPARPRAARVTPSVRRRAAAEPSGAAWAPPARAPGTLRSRIPAAYAEEKQNIRGGKGRAGVPGREDSYVTAYC